MNILFVCSGNTCRSPMAAALMKEMAKEKGLDVNVKSAGLFAWDGQEASREAIQVMKEEGIDIKDHRSNIIYRNLVEDADLILTMGVNHKEQLLSKYSFLRGKVYTLKEYAYGKEEDIEDPFGRGIQAYIKAKEEIKKAIEKIVEQLIIEN